MTDETKPTDLAAKARLALEMKRKAKENAQPASRGTLWGFEAQEAARSASKSKPKKRK